jgi:hypothetical protein
MTICMHLYNEQVGVFGVTTLEGNRRAEMELWIAVFPVRD